MKTWQKWLLTLVGAVLIALFAFVMALGRAQAIELITNPPGERSVVDETPSDYSLPYEEVTVTTSDGLRLVGWYIPSQNGAVIIAQHGYKGNRSNLLEEAAMLQRHGYGALVTSVRAHDLCDGEVISFGNLEMQDLDAWYQLLLTLPEVDRDKIGVLGNSMGGSLVIQYAAQNENIKAVVAHSAFSSLDDTVATSIEYFTDLPAFPFAQVIVFWAERELGFNSSGISARTWIAEISPRPVLLLHGGNDVVISEGSGKLLFDAAGEPKELWYEPALGHVQFDTEMPDAFEARIVGFFDEYILGR